MASRLKEDEKNERVIRGLLKLQPNRRCINCNSLPFSSPIPGLEHFSSSGNFVCFESIKVASDQLLEAVQDGNNCNKIGLYGKRGSGKTELVKAVGEKAKYLKIFDAVFFVAMSQNPNVVKMIQDHQIAETLNIKLDKNTIEAAREIKMRLEGMDRILVILDDVRAKLELDDIGIHCGSSNKCKVKVLLTTHSQRECALMKCQREIPLGPLSKEEAWTLLKLHSGIDDDGSSSFDSNLLSVAQEVVLECEGLPGTIKDVGSSLKSKKHIEEWKATLDSLRHSMARYHVFLSFRGEDTRYSFTGSLYRALCQEGGFKTFMDDDEVGLLWNNGDLISPSIIKAIESSGLSIVVLSENYASSPTCLDELAKILECMKINNQLVWPIFYKVEPLEIRHLNNSFGKAMAEHENKFGEDHSERVKKWRSALFQVSHLSGKTYKSGYEYEFIQKIVEDAINIENCLYIRGMDIWTRRKTFLLQ